MSKQRTVESTVESRLEQLEYEVARLQRAMFGEDGRNGVHSVVFGNSGKNGLKDRVDGHDTLLAKGWGFWGALVLMSGLLTLAASLGIKFFGGP